MTAATLPNIHAGEVFGSPNRNGDIVTARRTFGPARLDPEAYGKGRFLFADAKLYSLGGKQAPYFSVTGAYGTTRKLRNGWEGGDCCHEVIAEHFPELAPVIKVHLAGADGAPMHALEIARYWAGLSKYQDRDDEKLARHLRVDISELPDLDVSTADIIAHATEHVMADLYAVRRILQGTLLDEFCATLSDRWQADADAALAVLRAGVSA